jgi:3-deoxy-D-manno-octulosonate 8-phosphate phosphatase (KDO 8-P phosphatase)
MTKKPVIKLFLSDVDGVLTDAGMYYTEQGDEMKKFCTYDGMGFKMLKEAGIITGIITSEKVELNRRRADKLKLDFTVLGAADKIVEAEKIWSQTGISPAETAYIGDDINCLGLLSIVGWAACPPNSMTRVKAITGITLLSTPGGSGAVREFAELILAGFPISLDSNPWTM